jgi:ribosome assembly protein 1
MLYPDLYETTLVPKNKLEEDLFTANASGDAYVTAYVSKMFSVSAKDLPENKKKPITADEMRMKAREARISKHAAADSTTAIDRADGPTSTITECRPPTASEQVELKSRIDEGEVILGFARLYSGTIHTGTSVYTVLPKYNIALPPDDPSNMKHLIKAPVEGLYVMMGRELVPVDFVHAGNTFAIKGLEGKVWRSATLCSPGASGINDEHDVADACLINLGGVDRAVRLLVRIFVVQ